MLAEPGLGAYILVLANASFDAALYAHLEQRLEAAFGDLHAAAENCPNPDDLEVYQQLAALGGLEQIELAQFRPVGPWELQFNPLRALRPPRNAHAVIDRLRKPFNPDGFHFNKPFLRKESIWAGELGGRRAELLYNKFPFVFWHGLLVPEREREHPQYLSAAMHRYAWDVCAELGAGLPGLGLGYNAYGAYASVNHLHFQWFIRSQPLPLELPQWQHQGGDEAYPLTCLRFTDPEQAWQQLSAWHAANITYNLLYRPGCLYALPRRFQGSYAHAPWTGGYAWYEVCGGLTLFDAARFHDLQSGQLRGELARLQAPPLL